MKTRFAPSPTGYIHIGNMRTALFNALIAKHDPDGIFLLRIEDTDPERSKDEYMDALAEDLKWLGLHWQEGIIVEGPHKPYRQSHRQETYDKYYDELQSKDLAYPCFCSDEQLALSRKVQRAAGQPPRYDGRCARLTAEERQAKIDAGVAYTLRFKIPANQEVRFNDLVQSEKVFKTDDIGDFIIRRNNGTPSFMFCNAIDDALMQVTHALRGEDHITNTPRQLLILEALGLPAPQYGHFSLINGSDGSPLSKRNGSQSIKDMRAQGYWPEAVINYLARLGHYYEDPRLMTYDELGSNFLIKNLGRSPARYDVNQLMYWQNEVFKVKTLDDILEWLQDDVRAMVPRGRELLFAEVAGPNMMLHADAKLWAQRAFSENCLIDLSDDAKAVLENTDSAFFDAAINAVKTHGVDYAAWQDELKTALGVKGKQLFQPLRVALMGTLNGPEMNKWVNLLDDAELISKRFKAAQEWEQHVTYS